MSYNDYERSVQDAAPIECYKFIGTAQNYFYTSSDAQITLLGDVYEPAIVKRNSVRAGTQTDDNLSMDIELPFNLDVVKDYAYNSSPPSLVLEVYRVHLGSDYTTEYVLLWKGKVTSFTVSGRTAKFRVPSVFSRALQGDVPNAYYQTPCNHVLFDGRCRANRASFSTTTTVTLVGTNNLTVADDGFDDAYLKAGEVVCARSGERRMILNNVANTITVSYPFNDLRVGDSVELTAGCDHSFATCTAKFTNHANFGGHPYIPSDNPFAGRIS